MDYKLFKAVARTEMIRQTLTNIVMRHSKRRGIIGKEPTFYKIVGYEGIKRTFVRFLNSQERFQCNEGQQQIQGGQ